MTDGQAATAEHIATWDPPTVLAVVDALIAATSFLDSREEPYRVEALEVTLESLTHKILGGSS